MTEFRNNYNLEERTTIFSENLIDFYKKCPKNVITIPLINQGLRSGTSIGANYCEANGASSKKDFQNKIFICKKEAKETLYWFKLMGRALDDEKLEEECRKLWQEAKELTLIFSKIAFSTKNG
ncbi:MAG: four helix bundle protein [Candidatus Blackburnbacteria bacterium]|nr:four helix bundle protein [Candidatus Blackburnbacteria bacterium]